jgi:hypothetical protein
MQVMLPVNIFARCASTRACCAPVAAHQPEPHDDYGNEKDDERAFPIERGGDARRASERKLAGKPEPQQLLRLPPEITRQVKHENARTRESCPDFAGNTPSYRAYRKT